MRKIRRATPEDRAFVLRLAERLLDFGDVPGRDRAAMIQRDRDVLATALDGAGVVLIAEDDERPVGFIHLTTADDYYSATRTAHVADLVVDRDAAATGVGTALLAQAEEWGRTNGFLRLTLNVFTANQDARAFYLARGFSEEWIRCIKRL